MKYADLHLHTKYSDGTTTPRQNVIDSAINGIEVIAITDHDMTRGYFEAVSEAKKWGLEVITGVEVSTKKYHILGYGFDIENKTLQDILAYSREVQEEIMKERIGIINGMGPPLTFDKIKTLFPESRLGKYNIVMGMLQDPDCRTYTQGMDAWELFDSYIRNAHVKKDLKEKQLDSEQAISAIHEAGGIAVIAHPFKDVKRMGELDSLLAQGLDGLEVQPNFGDKNLPYAEFAKAKNLVVTYGSDFHGPAFQHRPLLKRKDNRIEEFYGMVKQR